MTTQKTVSLLISLFGHSSLLEVEKYGAKPCDVFAVLVILWVEVAEAGNTLPFLARRLFVPFLNEGLLRSPEKKVEVGNAIMRFTTSSLPQSE